MNIKGLKGDTVTKCYLMERNDTRDFFWVAFIWIIIDYNNVNIFSVTYLRLMLNHSLISLDVFVVALP